MACIKYLHDGLQNAFFACSNPASIHATAISSRHTYQRNKKEKEGVGGCKNNRAYHHQTPIAGETTTVLREGWLLLISGVSNLP
jgi:hypothetical protein